MPLMKLIFCLQESLGSVINIQTLDFISYKGTVIYFDDYCNIKLKDVDIFTDEKVIYKEDIFIRGSQIRLIQIPPILKYLLQ